MAVYKNVASQKIAVYAHDTAADEAKTGDAANITAQISKDGAATAATDDANPTELDSTDAPGIYLFDLTQAETNADLIILCAASSTGDIIVEPVVIYTLPGDNSGIDADLSSLNDLSAAEVNAEVDTALADYDAPTKAELDSGLAGLNDLSAAQVNAEVDTALGDYDAPTKAELDSGLAGLNDLSAAQVNAEVDTALADYDGPTKAELDSGLAGLNDPTAAAIRAEMDSNSTQLAAIVADTNELQTDDIPGLIAALNNLSAADVNAQVDAAFTTQMSDSVPSDGVLATREQALYIITQFLTERSVSGTTVTVKKVDGATALMTLNLDDGTEPTSITRNG